MARLGVIAEDDSDIETLKILIRRMTNCQVSFKKYAAKGCGKLRRKAPRIASRYVNENTTYVIICHDLDSGDMGKYARLCRELRISIQGIRDSDRLICIVIPVQELEAWFLADVSLINRRFPGMNLRSIANPEGIPSPKEYIAKKSRTENCKPRYVNTIHNPQLAESLDLSEVSSKCPAFHPFRDFISSLCPSS